MQVPEHVSKAKLAWFGSHSSRPEACVPLIREAVTSHDMQSQCVTVTKDSYVHGVCFKDFASLDRCVLCITALLPSITVMQLFRHLGFPSSGIFWLYFRPI